MLKKEQKNEAALTIYMFYIKLHATFYQHFENGPLTRKRELVKNVCNSHVYK